MALPIVESRVSDALRSEGYALADLTVEQLARAAGPRRGLGGHALVTWVIEGKGLAEQLKEAAATREVRRAAE